MGRFLAALGLALAASGCGDLLSVDDPSRFLDSDLDDPRILGAVANGLEGRLHLIFDEVAWRTGMLSDEIMHVGTRTDYEEISAGRIRQGGGTDGGASTLLEIRTEAQEAQERFRRVLGDTAESSLLMARAKAVEGWTNLIVGQMTCESVAVPGGPAVTDTMMFQEAIKPLSDAIAIAATKGDAGSKYLYLAYAGRARANLLIGNYDQAFADASAVPAEGFIYEALFSEQSGTNVIATLGAHTQNKQLGLRDIYWSQVDTIAGFLRDPWTGELDPRVEIIHRIGNRLATDGLTPFYGQMKYPTISSAIPITHSAEMRLIEAEVLWAKGEYQDAMDKLNNEVRAKVGLSPVPNPGTRDGVLEVLLSERYAQLWLEGQRTHDLYRFGLVTKLLGPDRAVKFPMSDSEVRYNDNIQPKVRSCPARS